MRWRCRLGWHRYTPWGVVRQRQLILTEYATGKRRLLGYEIEEQRCCQGCQKRQWRWKTKKRGADAHLPD
mgnify:CR=1 FL=1